MSKKDKETIDDILTELSCKGWQESVHEIEKALEEKNKEIERLKEEIDLCDTNKRVIKDLNKSLTEVHKEKERLNKVLKYLELYFSNREDYQLSRLIRDTKLANIEWLDKAIGGGKE